MSDTSTQSANLTPQRLVPPVPLHIAIEFAQHDETDHLEHEITIKMAGMAEPLLWLRIESDFYELPRVLEWYDDGACLGLPHRLRDAFVFLCFDLTVMRLLDAGGVRAWLRLRDARRFMEVAFVTDEADALVDAFTAHAVTGVEINFDQSCVEID